MLCWSGQADSEIGLYSQQVRMLAAVTAAFPREFTILYQPMGRSTDLIARIAATVCFIGDMPFAPGTFGALAALACVWIFQPTDMELVVVTAAVVVAGLASAGHVARLADDKDPGDVVIDEFAGYLVSVAFLPLTAGYLIAAFFLFRVFDILKPFPVGAIERRLSGGIGIMLDDIAAGVITNLLLQLWRLL